MLWVPSFVPGRRAAGSADVRVAVAGAGTFGRGVVVQGTHAPGLDVCAVVDTDIEAASQALTAAGIEARAVGVCETRAEVCAAWMAGRRVVATDVEIVLEAGVDVLVEATGHAGAGAKHAALAAAHGAHVAMVTKETDAAVGPILRQRADQAGLAYIPVDGDQHGLLIGLVRWARSVGLDVLCGGKALDGELVAAGSSGGTAAAGGARESAGAGGLESAATDADCFVPATPGSPLRAAVSERAKRLGPAGRAQPWDLTELCIAANATGLVPDTPRLHCPAVWTSEIAAALCPSAYGGLLGRNTGVLDAVQIVRGRHEAGMGGGVFVVVKVPAGIGKSQFQVEWTTADGTARIGLVTHPQHLLGIEAISSVLAAATLGPAAGSDDYRPRVDVVYRARRPLRAGQLVGDDHSPELVAELVTAGPMGSDTPLPAGLATGNRLRHDVPEGAFITAGAVERPAESWLWRLRGEQDRAFLG